MKYFVSLAGREFEVELEVGADGELHAEIDGQRHEVDVVAVEALRHYSVLLDRRSYNVVLDAAGPELQLQMGERHYSVRVENLRERSARAIEAAAPQGPVTVQSIMPGIIRKVQVKAGDKVAKGQALVILEAMKMENEILAEQAGIVREVRVEAGSKVETGARLVLLDPL